MRLINTSSIDLHEFIGDENVPPYAILSHTWEDQEVTYQGMKCRDSNLSIASMKGYDKIVKCCQQASQQGLDWAWVDTCCIDKASSAELSEAINSMYRWYENADICYAFLSDVTPALYQAGGLGHSRWFTRGWTLQELIAPKQVIFFASNWEALNTKTGLPDRLELITSVPEAILMHRQHVTQASVAMRMSWAAKRKTTRSEDLAYCLIGLFDINIPLIYGEGRKAFQRLQEEIVRTQPYEHTIYAWGTFSIYGKDPCPKEFTAHEDLGIDTSAMPLRTKVEWDEEIAKQPFLGMLAESPADFDGCGRFVPSVQAQQLMTSSMQPFFPPIFMHGGMRLRLHCRAGQTAHHLLRPPIIQLRGTLYVSLLVQDSSISTETCVVIPMIAWLDHVWGRKFKAFVSIDRAGHEEGEKEIFIAPEQKQDTWSRHLRSGDILFRWPSTPVNHRDHRLRLVWANANQWRKLYGKQALVRHGSAQSLTELQSHGHVASWAWKKMYSPHRYWCIIIHRVPDPNRPRWGALAISLQCLSTPEDLGAVVQALPYEEVAKIASCSHVMRNATEVWRPEAEGLPTGIAFCVEVIWDAVYDIHVDVVDFRFPDGEGDTHVYVPRAD